MNLTIRMGGVSYIAEYAMDGPTARRVSVPGTIGIGLKVGRAIRLAREAHVDPFQAIIDTLGETTYSPARIIFTGKVTELERRTERGFALGTVKIAELSRSGATGGETLEIEIQNENLIARTSSGQVLAVVPDLICILDSETAEPITTEELRYGQRVTVMTVSVPPIMRTKAALEVWGPRHFGYDMDYVPMAGAVPTGEE